MNLAFENKVAIDLIQAMLGAISPNMRSISFECQNEKIMVYFVLEAEDETDREECSDIIFEFEALQEKVLDIGYQIDISSSIRKSGISSIKGRAVYARRES